MNQCLFEYSHGCTDLSIVFLLRFLWLCVIRDKAKNLNFNLAHVELIFCCYIEN